MSTPMKCPRCRSGDLAFDLATDEQIFLSFWVCPACGQRGVARVVDRRPPHVEAPPVARPVQGLSGRCTAPPARMGRRTRRSDVSRA